jgi:hypothetical protein
VDITVYLPDEIGAQAKAADLNLSRMLRDAVTDELDRRTTVETTLDGAHEIKFELVDDEGGSYIGRITGRIIADDSDRERGVCVYLTDDERIIAHSEYDGKYWQPDNAEDLRPHLSAGAYVDACKALGVDAVVDL